jgi:hypothetical protein
MTTPFASLKSPLTLTLQPINPPATPSLTDNRLTLSRTTNYTNTSTFMDHSKRQRS